MDKALGWLVIVVFIALAVLIGDGQLYTGSE